MEMTLRVVVVMILILIGLFVFASLIFDWGGDMNEIFEGTTSQLTKFILGD
jgi:hypothetical protein